MSNPGKWKIIGVLALIKSVAVCYGIDYSVECQRLKNSPNDYYSSGRALGPAFKKVGVPASQFIDSANIPYGPETNDLFIAAAEHNGDSCNIATPLIELNEQMSKLAAQREQQSKNQKLATDGISKITAQAKQINDQKIKIYNKLGERDDRIIAAVNNIRSSEPNAKQALISLNKQMEEAKESYRSQLGKIEKDNKQFENSTTISERSASNMSGASPSHGQGIGAIGALAPGLLAGSQSTKSNEHKNADVSDKQSLDAKQSDLSLTSAKYLDNDGKSDGDSNASDEKDQSANEDSALEGEKPLDKKSLEEKLVRRLYELEKSKQGKQSKDSTGASLASSSTNQQYQEASIPRRESLTEWMGTNTKARDFRSDKGTDNIMKNILDSAIKNSRDLAQVNLFSELDQTYAKEQGILQKDTDTLFFRVKSKLNQKYFWEKK